MGWGWEKDRRGEGGKKKKRIDHDVIDTCDTRACLVHDVTDTDCNNNHNNKKKKKKKKKKRKNGNAHERVFPLFKRSIYRTKDKLDH